MSRTEMYWFGIKISVGVLLLSFSLRQVKLSESCPEAKS